MHRAFHAMQTPLTAPDGQPTNAVFGFFSMLSKTLKLLRPDALVVAFDDGKPTARIEALAQYKIQRKPTDPDLKAQFPIIKELLEAMQVPVACIPNVEGDDILGTLSLQGEACGMEIYLATSDRDAYQLVTESTKVISQGRGADGPRIIGPAEVFDRCGVTPDQIIDYLGLKGDTSDNIPGVPGVGEKTATKFLVEYGTLDAVLQAAAAGKVKGKVGQNLVEHRDAAEVSRTVATILRDIPLDIDLEDVSFGNYSADDIQAVFMHYGLRSPLNWMIQFANLAGSNSESANPSAESDQNPHNPQAISSPYTGVVLSTSGDTLFDNEQVLAKGSTGTKDSSNGSDNTTGIIRNTSVAADLAQLIQSNERIAAESLKELFEQIVPLDSAIAPEIDPNELDSEGDFDLSLAAYLLASHKTNFSLAAIALEYLGTDINELSSSGEDDSDTDTDNKDVQKAVLIARLAAVLENRLDKDSSLELFRTMELPLIPVLTRMERAGISIDLARMDELAQLGRDRIETLRSEVFELAGTDDFNPDSPKQLAEILFDRLGLPVIKKTKTGRSTNAAVLAELKAHHPIAEKITEYRESTKLQNTYLEALPKLIATDGRIHTSFNQAVTATGRLSSSSPNLQNIPVRTEAGRQIRTAFVPKQGWKLLSADYSQIELRVLAQLSQDAGLIEAFNSGEDFHAETAARIFGLDGQHLEGAQQVDPALRSRAKAVNFGIIYGQGPHGLSQALDIAYGEAKEIIDRYYATFPGVKRYLDQLVQEAHDQGWVATYFGRKRHIPELKSGNRSLRAFGERTAMNHPMQGTAADLIKLAMIAVDQQLRESGLQATMLLQVHDELVFEAPAGELDQLRQLVVAAMTDVAPDFTVPLEVSVTVGDTWS